MSGEIRENISGYKFTVVSHITDLSGPTEALENFLVSQKVSQLDLIYHPFYYCKDNSNKLKRYIKGEKSSERNIFKICLPEKVMFLKDFLVSIFYFLFFIRKTDIYVGANPLNAFVGLMFKKIGLCKKVILYTIDWMPDRFSNKFINKVYHFVDRYAARNADLLWNISQKICDIRKETGVDDEKNLLVPIGVELEKISHVADSEAIKNRYKLVLLGALAPSKGVDLVIDAYPKLKAAVPEIELYIIGRTPDNGVEDGKVFEPYEDRLAALGDSVHLLGVKPHDEVLELLPSLGPGIALYAPSSGNLSKWADPSRVKDYLACALPVVISPVPEIALAIDKQNMGKLTEYTVDAFIGSIKTIVENNDLFLAMKNNAVKYMESYSWSNIFIKSLEKVI